MKNSKRRFSPFMAFSLVSALLYTAVVVFKLLKNTRGVMFYILLGFTAAYLLFFVATIAVNSRNKKAVKEAIADNRSNLKIYKSGVKILKKLMILFNLVAAALLAFQTSGTLSSKILAIATCVFSGGFALFCIIGNIFKIRKTVKKRTKKGKKTLEIEQKNRKNDPETARFRQKNSLSESKNAAVLPENAAVSSKNNTVSDKIKDAFSDKNGLCHDKTDAKTGVSADILPEKSFFKRKNRK